MKLDCKTLVGTLAVGLLAMCPAFAQSDAKTSAQHGAANRMGSDSTFVTKAAVGGLAEVKLGQLATQKAASPDVKQFGQQMVDDHGKANDELKQLAAGKGITLPTSLDKKHKQTYSHMSRLTGQNFDHAYAADMVKDHQKDVSEFEKEATSGTDPDVKAWAAKTLPTLQEHLRMAQSLPGASTK